MSRIIELADAAGFEDAKLLGSVWVENTDVTALIEKFYTLASADLEAENAKLREALEEISDHAPWGGSKDKYIAWLRDQARAALGKTKC